MKIKRFAFVSGMEGLIILVCCITLIYLFLMILFDNVFNYDIGKNFKEILGTLRSGKK